MTDETKTNDQKDNAIPTPVDLSVGDIIDFLEQNAATPQCPVCRNTAWTVIPTVEENSEHPAHFAIGTANTMGELFLGGRNLPLVPVICSKCAYIRFHARVPIQQWVAKRKAEKPNA